MDPPLWYWMKPRSQGTMKPLASCNHFLSSSRGWESPKCRGKVWNMAGKTMENYEQKGWNQQVDELLKFLCRRKWEYHQELRSCTNRHGSISLVDKRRVKTCGNQQCLRSTFDFSGCSSKYGSNWYFYPISGSWNPSISLIGRFSKMVGFPKSSMLDWDFPWNKPSILGYPYLWQPPIGLWGISTPGDASTVEVTIEAQP